MNKDNFIISAEQLNEMLTKKNACQDASAAIKILYTTMHEGPGVKPAIVIQRPNEYIPQSIAFDFQKQFADTNSSLSNTMVNPHEFQEQARKLGINNEDTLIVYDDYGNFCASRVWFMFKSMGHNSIVILDGGLPAWLREKFATVTKLIETNDETARGNFNATANKSFEFVGKQAILDNLANAQHQVLDARGLARFKGAEPESKANIRAGHIPQSNSLHYARCQDDNGKFLSIEELTVLFAPYTEKPLIFSCGSGVTACILAQAATMIGIKQVQVYDGSWSQWGADNSLPIATGD